jgi:type II secretory pathway pseudopilin PulG
MNYSNHAATKNPNGFTIMQMIVTIAIIAVVTTFGVLGITNARAEFRQQNSARVFASYLEKARADSVRRHATPGNESSVETFAPGTNIYAVTMDFGSGTVETRNFQLEPGISFNTAPKKLSFDWRGRIPEWWVFQVRSDTLKKNVPVDVSGSGDITVGEQRFPDLLIPAIEISEVTGGTIPDPSPTPTATPPPSASPSPTASPTESPSGTPTPTPTPTPSPTPTPHGNGNGGDNGNGNPHSTPTPTPDPTPTVAPTPVPTPVLPPPCVASLSSNTLLLSQSDPNHTTGTVVFRLANVTGTHTISATLLGNGNSLNISLSQVRLSSDGSTTISISSKNGAGNRGVFLVDISASPSCGVTQQLAVTVSN